MRWVESPAPPKPVANASATGVNSGSITGGGQSNMNNSHIVGDASVVTATTQFLDSSPPDTIVIRETRDNSLTIGPIDSSDIKTFMAKPVLLSTFTFDSTVAAGAAIFAYDIEGLLVGALAKKIWVNKLSGYRLMRGTAVIRIVINAQPFQAGRLILTFLPQFSNFNAYSTTYNAMHNANVTTLTQQPNVEVDVRDGVAEIEAPYVGPANWYSREEGFGFGRVSCYALSPLRSAASTSVDVAVYAYFKDFEVTAPQFGPEMNAPLTKKSAAERTRTRKAGVVSNFLDAVAKPFDLLRGVPIIGSNAGLISDATIQVSKVFSMFGWSRPIDMRPPTALRLQPNYQNFNYNGQNISDVLSLDAASQVAPMDNFGGAGIDEMSFNYLKGIPALYTNFSITTSQASGTLVFSQTIELPSFVREVGTSGPASSVYTTGYAPPFVFLSRYFNYWRGGIVITLKFVKTQFHSGRYEIVYTPSPIASGVSADTENPYILREVVDISVDDTFSFIVPYYSEVPWQMSGWRPYDAANDTNGLLKINVLNKLVASSTVSSTVDVLVYANAAEDFQLSGLIGVTKPIFVPEMALPRVIGSIADGKQPDVTIDPSALCGGEIFTSVKQLYQCPRPVGLSPDESGTFEGTNFWPYALGPLTLGVTSESLAVPVWYGDYLSEIGLGFAYNRGGIRMFSPGSTLGNGIAYLGYAAQGDFVNSGLNPLPGPTTSNFLSVGSTLLAPLAMRSTTGCSLDAIIPHGARTPFRLSYPITRSVGVVPLSKDSPNFAINMKFPTQGTTYAPETYRFYRSGADDYASGFFIGFPGFLIETQPA